MTKLWGGRFSKQTNALVEELSNSIHFDYKLAKYDCIGSLTHIEILKKAKLLTVTEHGQLKKALKEILKTVESGKFKIDESFEDIHSYIQHLVEKKAGKAALKLHTCRSRNDQVVFDTKLYCLENILVTEKCLLAFSESLKKLGDKNKDIFIPGYTHLQHAIPVAITDYLDAYCKMAEADETKLLNAYNNITLTMGSGALAGTFINAKHYDSKKTSECDKGVEAATNSLETVSSRDFVIECLSVLSIIGMHLSRLSEDMILWASQEFDFVDIDDAFCTGSSLMPQKKNPDVFELIRGQTGRLYGNLVNVLVMMKGLPLSYNRDMQHDKEPLFDSFKIVQDALEVLTALFKNIKFKKANIQKQLDDECLYATDIADYLVQNKVAFKDAHGIVGKLVQLKLQSKTNIVDMDAKTLAEIHPLLKPNVIKKIINPETSVKAKKSIKRT
ncbi:MAG: argininosuccinate lyase [Candidatus Omnitrophica bacterium]|nr:argininosuccinate lyase [Candidatus Omnitrophota bacterium]